MPLTRRPRRLPVILGACLCNVAGAAPAAGWSGLITEKVILFGAAALALLVISLLLRGLLKLITLALVAVLAIGAFWFLREAWDHRTELIPPAWSALARSTLDRPAARDAWKSIEAELSRLSSETRQRLSAGTDDTRRTLLLKIQDHARDLRRDGHQAEAAQLERLADLIGREK